MSAAVLRKRAPAGTPRSRASAERDRPLHHPGSFANRMPRRYAQHLDELGQVLPQGRLRAALVGDS
jgi:hypothetical protein